MNSVILQLAAKYIRALLVFFAFVALLRGHNQPGGGFIGGLLAALSIVYYSFAFDRQKIRKQLTIKPEGYIALGLLIILLSFLPSIIQGETLMKGIWISIPLYPLEELKLGTPLLFDIGVFMAVIGITLLFFFTLTKSR